MPLTDTAIRNAKPRAKPFKLNDGGGLFLLMMPSGGKWWRFRYMMDGKEKLLSLGIYPDVPLAGHKDRKTGEWIEGAREKRDHARKLLASEIDPGAVRKAAKDAKSESRRNTFESVAREWLAQRDSGWKPITAAGKLSRLEIDVFPRIGSKPIRNLTSRDLVEVLNAVQARGAAELARRVRQLFGQIFRFAVATGRVDRNPAGDLRDALPPASPKHHAALTEPKAVGALMRAISGY